MDRIKNHTKNMENKSDKPVVVVVGAGLIGTLSAYWLSYSNRYKVICIDKGPAPASGTSKANAGRFCPSLLGDFAPKLSTLKSLLLPTTEAGVGNVDWSPSVISWGVKYLHAAGLKRAEVNETLSELGSLSTTLMNHLMHNVIKLEKTDHNIWVYDNESSLAGGKALLDANSGAKYSALEPTKCAALTSLSLSIFGKNGGCLNVESDFTADARVFTEQVAKDSSLKHSCEFRFNSAVEKINRNEQGKLSSVQLQDGSIIPCDFMVVACGPWTNHFMSKWFGLTFPIMPLRGASVQLEDVSNRPTIGFADHTSGDLHFQVTPIGKTSLRLAGFADVVSDPLSNQIDVECSSKYKHALLARLRVAMPEVTWKNESAVWCGLRPVTPDRLPIIGPSGAPDVYLNVGHGAIGWTLAAVSGYLLCATMLKDHGYPALGIAEEGDKFNVKKKLGVDRFWPL